MKKKASLIQTLVFLAFTGVLCVLHFALPDRSFSERENRSLQTAPPFSFSALFSGKLTESLESYVSDQFPFRDGWTALKARTELLTGKEENNGVFLCENETLIEPYTAPARNELDFRVDAVRALAETAGAPVYFALVPSACEIWKEKLPDGAPNDSQRETADAAYAMSGAVNVDLFSVLEAHRDEPIYYRTDHHWTTLGAYYGYTALAAAFGFEPVPLGDYTETVVTEEFYGTAYSASGFSWVRPDAISAYVEQGDAEIVNYPQGTALPGTLYDEEFLGKKDKYSYFYGGNTPLLTVDTGHDGPSLLILRDSYMDSLSPFLFAHFSQLHILDLRYYKTSLKAYLAEHPVDGVLVCYNVKSFGEDGSVFLAAY